MAAEGEKQYSLVDKAVAGGEEQCSPVDKADDKAIARGEKVVVLEITITKDSNKIVLIGDDLRRLVAMKSLF